MVSSQKSCAWLQHRRSGSLQHNGGITPVASFKDLASASQQAFAQGGAPASKPGGSPSPQVQGCLHPALHACSRLSIGHVHFLWQHARVQPCSHGLMTPAGPSLC